VADFHCIAAVGRSIQRVLDLGFQESQPVPGRNTRAVLVRTEDLQQDNIAGAISMPALSIFLYRVDYSKTMRAAWSAVASQDGRSHLPLDLHFLLTPWAENAEFEYRILGRAMQCLESTPIFSGPLLDPLANWATNEAIQIYLAELTTEEVMRTFDSLPLDYKLSVPYVAKTVRIDGQVQTLTRPVTTLKTGNEASINP
jgi:hypothetical protein